MRHDYLTKRVCHDCLAKPGQLHEGGCDVERCPLCGGQIISCGCVYELNGMPRARLKQDHPKIYKGGPTGAMLEKFAVEIEKAGGRIPWTGIWPGVEECVEFGWYSKRAKIGYQKCGPDDPEAGPDLNRLGQDAVWNREKRRWVRPS